MGSVYRPLQCACHGLSTALHPWGLGLRSLNSSGPPFPTCVAWESGLGQAPSRRPGAGAHGVQSGHIPPLPATCHQKRIQR